MVTKTARWEAEASSSRFLVDELAPGTSSGEQRPGLSPSEVSPLKSPKSGVDWPVALANPWLKRILAKAHRALVGLTLQLLLLLRTHTLLDSDLGIGQLLECVRSVEQTSSPRRADCQSARKSEIPALFLISNQLVMLLPLSRHDSHARSAI